MAGGVEKSGVFDPRDPGERLEVHPVLLFAGGDVAPGRVIR